MSEQQPQVTVQTLANVINILDVCTKRGVFQTSELEIVGKTYNEINNFVKAVQAQQELNKVEAGDNSQPAGDNSQPASDNSQTASDNNTVNDTTDKQVV